MSGNGEEKKMQPLKMHDDKIKEQQEMSEAQKRIGHKIVVLSGKGGVGKSTVAVNLAVTLANRGYRVGLMDIDIHGPSTPKMLGLEGHPVHATDDEKIIPINYNDNLKVMSLGLLSRNVDDAVVWRAPLKNGVIKQFIKDVVWEDLDYLVVDSPPGTGDEPLSIVQFLENPDGAVIVTTPQDVALLDVRKSVNFCKKMSMPVIGVVENMSYFVCPHCSNRVEIFKSGGGEKMSSDMDVPFLGSLPLETDIALKADDGSPFANEVGGDNLSDAMKSFDAIVSGIVEYAEKKQ